MEKWAQRFFSPAQMFSFCLGTSGLVRRECVTSVTSSSCSIQHPLSGPVMWISFISAFSDQLPPSPTPPVIAIFLWQVLKYVNGDKVYWPWEGFLLHFWRFRGAIGRIWGFWRWPESPNTAPSGKRGQWRPMFSSSSSPLRFEGFSKTPYSRAGYLTPTASPFC